MPDETAAVSPQAAEAAVFFVFKIAGNGEPVLLESTPTLDAAVAWVVSLRELFPGEYRIVHEATGKRIVFTKQGVLSEQGVLSDMEIVSDVEIEGDC